MARVAGSQSNSRQPVESTLHVVSSMRLRDGFTGLRVGWPVERETRRAHCMLCEACGCGFTGLRVGWPVEREANGIPEEPVEHTACCVKHVVAGLRVYRLDGPWSGKLEGDIPWSGKPEEEGSTC